MSTALEQPRRHSVTVEEYMRMGEAGVFAPDARLELIEGEIIEMAPIGPPHSGIVIRLTRLFFQRAGDRAIVSVQQPAVISDRSVPQPDLQLLKPRADDYQRSHPTATDILLAVEVSDTTLRFDIGRKAPLYARCGIRELWIVDINKALIRVYREPAPAGYRSTFIVEGEGRVASLLVPEVFVAASELFPAQGG